MSPEEARDLHLTKDWPSPVDTDQAAHVARKIVVRAIKAPCSGCSRPLPPDKLHWSPLTGGYLCYICGAGKRRGPTLREVLQRMTKPASGSQAAAP